MKSYEALHAAINGKTVEHSKKLGLATVTVNKWQEPHTDYTDSGAYNPLDRVDTIIETSLSFKNPPEKVFAPIFYLAEKFNLIVINTPTTFRSNAECIRELSLIIKEFGELVTVASKRLEDGNISKADFKAIDKEGHDLIRQVVSFLERVKKSQEG